MVRHTMQHPPRTLILSVSLGLALLVGFLAPRPTFVDSIFNGPSEYDGASETSEEKTKSDASSIQRTADGNHPLVSVDFYGESLCPDCRHMVLDVLDPLFENGISDLIDLRYIAYGNVRGDLTKGDKITCQHGYKECLYNRHINCAQKLLDYDQDKWFPFVKCMAEKMSSLDKNAASCAEKVDLSPNDVATCAEGEEGDALELAAAKETGALIPKHTFVPWVVVNGVALGGAFEDLDRYVCAASPPKTR